MNKIVRLVVDGLLVVLFLGLLLMPISSVGLTTFKTSNVQVLGTQVEPEGIEDQEEGTRKHYQVREVSPTPQTTQTTEANR